MIGKVHDQENKNKVVGKRSNPVIYLRINYFLLAEGREY